jgi:hypothetical protein
MSLRSASRQLAIRRGSRAKIDARAFTTSRPQFDVSPGSNKPESDPSPSPSQESASSSKSAYSDLFDNLRATALTQAQHLSALANERIVRLQLREKLGALGNRLNSVTGYEEIERLKDEVANKGQSGHG